MRDDDIVRLDLVEVDSADALARSEGSTASAAPALEGADDERGPGRRLLRGWRGVAVGGAVVVALAAVGGVLALRDAREIEDRREAFEQAGLPFVDLASPLSEAWRLEDSWLAATTADVLVVGSGSPSATMWRGVDPVTGRVRWEVPGADGWCRAWNPRDAAARPPTVPSDPTLLAVVDARFDGALPTGAAGTDVRVLDLATGQERATLLFPGDVVSIEPVGESVVAVAVGMDGAFSVARASLAGGSLWTAPTPFSTVGQAAVPALDVSVVDGVVFLLTFDGVPVAAFDLETGAALEPGDGGLPSPAGRLALADGGRAETLVTTQRMADGRYYLGEPVVAVTGPDGAVRFRADGRLLVPEFSDDAAPERLLVAGTGDGASGFAALDVGTGEVAWSAPEPVLGLRLLVGGVLVHESLGVVALDLSSGERLWQYEASIRVPGRPVTDGTRVLVVGAGDGGRSLVALDLRTGAEAWSVPTPAVTGLDAVPGGVVVSTRDGLIGYR